MLSLPICFLDTGYIQRNLIFISSITAVTSMGKGQLCSAVLSVPITSIGKRAPVCSIHLDGRLFQLQQLKYILSPNCIHHRCFLQIHSATLKQLSFCKQNGFSSLIWETAVIQITSLKSLPLPNFFESQLTHNNTKRE